MKLMVTGVPVVAAALMWGAAASADCTIAKVAEFPVTMQAMKPLTDAKVNGVDVRFTLDSGAFFSVISPGNANALGLHPVALNARMRGINGDAAMSVVTVKSLIIAGQEVPQIEFVVAGSDLGRSGVGVIGQNLLGIADVEYDLPHGVVRLIKPHGCDRTSLAYWAGSRPFSIVEFGPRQPNDRHTIGVVTLNGVRVNATFDTGAGTTILSMAAAARAGITPKSPGVEPAGVVTGFGRKLVRTWIASFDSLHVGDQEELRHIRIRFGEMQSDTDMLIGADFFISHRIYVANSRKRIFLTYEGGPVFDLKATHQDNTGAMIADPTPDAADTPTTADGFSRAGAVKLARNDRDGALADFDKAIALDPKRPSYLLQRAQIFLATGRRASAVIDIDAALALAPDDVDAHILRARLLLVENGIGAPGMVADLDAADRAAPPAADQRFWLGSLYDDAGGASKAVHQFDLWITYHPDDVRRPSALNGRCWVRALANTDLPAALSDCNAAIRQRPTESAFIDSRALVELRLGQFAKAIQDYDKALAMTPSPWSLYARGIAKLRSGDASGKADVDAGLAKHPAVAARAKLYDLMP